MTVLDTPFLERFRDLTEAAWRAGRGSWQPRTRWTGPADVDRLERELGCIFPEEHRLFLATLHSTTPRRRVRRYRGSTPVIVEVPGFYDWVHERHEIDAALERVIGGLVFDVEQNALWPADWGARPPTADARERRVRALVADAPRLFPIFEHRFVVAGTPGLVLSIHQSDVIVYGGNLREYLENELGPELGLGRRHEVAEGSPEVPFWGALG